MPGSDDSYDTEQVVAVGSITSGCDHTYLIDADDRGKLLVYGDGCGGPEFRLANDL